MVTEVGEVGWGFGEKCGIARAAERELAESKQRLTKVHPTELRTLQRLEVWGARRSTLFP